NPVIESTVERVTGAGSVTIAEGARSVTVVVYAGAPTVAIGGGTAVALPAGTSLSWGVNQGGAPGEMLQDEFVFTGLAGHDFLVTSTREVEAVAEGTDGAYIPATGRVVSARGVTDVAGNVTFSWPA